MLVERHGHAWPRVAPIVPDRDGRAPPQSGSQKERAFDPNRDWRAPPQGGSQKERALRTYSSVWRPE